MISHSNRTESKPDARLRVVASVCDNADDRHHVHPECGDISSTRNLTGAEEEACLHVSKMMLKTLCLMCYPVADLQTDQQYYLTSVTGVDSSFFTLVASVSTR